MVVRVLTNHVAPLGTALLCSVLTHARLLVVFTSQQRALALTVMD